MLIYVARVTISAQPYHWLNNENKAYNILMHSKNIENYFLNSAGGVSLLKSLQRNNYKPM